MIDNDGPKMTGVVEVDETYIGGKQCGGDLRLMHVEHNTSAELGAQIRKNVSPDVKMIVTDEVSAYPSAMISASGSHARNRRIIRRNPLNSSTTRPGRGR
jgi:hypothetical protein